jgi:hypothetical protein
LGALCPISGPLLSIDIFLQKHSSIMFK